MHKPNPKTTQQIILMAPRVQILNPSAHIVPVRAPRWTWAPGTAGNTLAKLLPFLRYMHSGYWQDACIPSPFHNNLLSRISHVVPLTASNWQFPQNCLKVSTEPQHCTGTISKLGARSQHCKPHFHISDVFQVFHYCLIWLFWFVFFSPQDWIPELVEGQKLLWRSQQEVGWLWELMLSLIDSSCFPLVFSQ